MMDVIILNTPPQDVIQLKYPFPMDVIQLNKPALEVLQLRPSPYDIIIFPQITTDELGNPVLVDGDAGHAYIVDADPGNAPINTYSG